MQKKTNETNHTNHLFSIVPSHLDNETQMLVEQVQLKHYQQHSVDYIAAQQSRNRFSRNYISCLQQ